MNSKINAIIIDDNNDFCNLLSDYFLRHKDITIIGIGNDGKEGLKLIQEKKPDLILLDMIMPKLDGLGVLEELSSMEIHPIPEIIVLSAMGHDKITLRALSAGADYYISKPFDMDILAKRIIELFSVSPYNVNSNKSNSVINISHNRQIKNNCIDLETQITNVMLEIGIPAHIKGYAFIREALRAYINDSIHIPSITKDLYPQIAMKFNTTSSRVERAIRHAIDVGWSRSNIETINKFFKYTLNPDKKRPTNAQFITILADIIRLKNKTS